MSNPMQLLLQDRIKPLLPSLKIVIIVANCVFIHEAEEPCVFTVDTIHCEANNLDTSTALLKSTLDNMSLAELGAITWLSINQNVGINRKFFCSLICKSAI